MAVGGVDVHGRVVAAELYFPEGLRWRDGALWFTDQYGGTVCRIGGGYEVVARMPGRPGGLGWTKDGTLLVVAMERRSVLSVAPGGALTLYADLSHLLPAYANDMLVDPQGRAYVGNYGFDVEHGEAEALTRIARVDPDRSTHVEPPELMFPNGTVLVDGGRTMVIAETFGDRLTELTVAPDGGLSDPRTLLELPKGSGPDGIAVDRAGRVWVACAFSSRAIAVTRAGEIDAEIEVPGEGVYCPEIGGPNGTTLYLGIASLDEEYAARTPTGRIEAYDL
ncbi:MAG TPA: SMP-30/gluconolactonase/LRE family protein [Mycobacteriales bacterium]|nr:SMP-30/gluconolactonase/LRE family protein [Mycobacteriales bacterium]